MTKTISLRVSPDVDRRIRLLSAVLGTTRSDFIRSALDEKMSETMLNLASLECREILTKFSNLLEAINENT